MLNELKVLICEQLKYYKVCRSRNVKKSSSGWILYRTGPGVRHLAAEPGSHVYSAVSGPDRAACGSGAGCVLCNPEMSGLSAGSAADGNKETRTMTNLINAHGESFLSWKIINISSLNQNHTEPSYGPGDHSFFC